MLIADQSRLLALVGYNLTRADVQMGKLFRELMEPLGLRPVEYSILCLIQDNEQLTQKALGTALDVSAPNLAVVLDRMAALDLIERERSQTDRRAQYVRLTAQGEEQLTVAHAVVIQMEARIKGQLSASESKVLIGLLQKLMVL
jgi:DNA-binding MarR family transcriptional regulator